MTARGRGARRRALVYGPALPVSPVEQPSDPAARPPERWRLAALVSHPIPYVVPLMRRLAAHPEIDLTVYFMTRTGLRPGFVKGYGGTIVWDIPLLDGYPHEFLPNVSRWPESGRPRAKINPAIVGALARGRYDALFLHGYSSVTEWMAFAAAKALRLPVLFWGDVLIDSRPILTRSSAARALFRRAFCAGIDAALALSTQARRYYERYGVPEGRIHWAPLCVDNASWIAKVDALRPRRAELRKGFGADPDLPAIAYVAHMRPNKRPRDVIAAFSRMKTPASLLMAGGDGLFDELCAEQARQPVPRVHLLGPRNQSELPALYAAADAFVLPSGPGEVTPLVVLEAMCAGLPLVISDAVPSIVDFVREGENGFTHPVGDVAALAGRLDAILGDPAAQARMGARSREIIAAWTYDVTVGAVVDALRAVTRPRAGSR